MMREDWIEVELGEVCQVNMGQSPPSSTYNIDKKGLPFFQGKAEFTELHPIVKKWCTKPKKFAEINDILLSVRAPVGATNVANQKCAIGRGLAAISYKYNYKYILAYLRLIEKKLDGQGTGTTFRAISGNILKSQIIPLAPLPIQRAIVLKIESLFSSLDKGIADLKTAQEQLKVYRQAVLKKAFEGEFTKSWRAKQTNLQTVKELKETIDLSREKFYNQQIIEWEQAVQNWERNGKKDKKPSKPSKLVVPEKPNAEHDERKWPIPEPWIWTQVGTICFVTKLAGFEYTDYVKYDDEGDLTVLKAENAGVNGFKKTEFSKIKSETVEMLKRSFLFGGELLVVFVGAGTGNVAVVPKDRKYFLGPNIGMARPYFEINSRFLEFQLQSSVGKHMMMATVKAVAQPSLSMATIRQTPIAFPSVAEQNQIVREIESRLSVCDKVEQSISEALEKAEALRQSILKKAFEGKLLSEEEIAKCKQEADYEPASELLKKIKAKKE